GKVIFPCSPHGEHTVQSNWRKAQFGTLDFSGACVGTQAKPGVMCLLGMKSHLQLRENGAILMEDEDAVWISQVKGVKDWESMRRSGSVVF
ncbi:hypothetical protein DFH09DRAFT_1458431, partial [Mycena vulgaris]